MQKLTVVSSTLIPEVTIMDIHNDRDDVTVLIEIYEFIINRDISKDDYEFHPGEGLLISG